MKNLIKDSVRISLKELGQIYYNSGFLNEAQQQWNKSLDISIAEEDIFHMRYLLAKTACMNDQIYLTEKYSREALDQILGDGADPVTTSVLRVILTMHWIQEGHNKQAANEFLKLVIPDQPELADRLNGELSQVSTLQDLAFYMSLVSLHHFSRDALREQVLKSKSFAMLAESAGEAATIIDNYLNGDYSQFYLQLKHMRALLKYDPYFGEHAKCGTIFDEIRGKALQNHLKAYKVISLRDVADEFGESVDVIQQDVVNLIFAGKLDAKIDASNGMLHKRVEDPKLAMLQ